jgi:hypothetical protein
MMTLNKKYQECLNLISLQREWISPNIGFLLQLKQYEQELNIK